MASLSDISIVGVVVATLVNQVIGFVYFHPKVFGTVWMNLLGRKPDDPPTTPLGAAIGFGTLAALVSSVALAVIILTFGGAGWVDGLGLGALVAVGFLIPVLGTDAVYSGRSFNLYFLNATYYVIAFMAMGAVIGALQ